MVETLNTFAFDWMLTAVSLWIASHIFRGIKFSSSGALIVAGLLPVGNQCTDDFAGVKIGYRVQSGRLLDGTIRQHFCFIAEHGTSVDSW